MARKGFAFVCSLCVLAMTVFATFADEGGLEEFFGYKLGAYTTATDEEVERLTKLHPLPKPIGGFTEVALEYSDDYRLQAVRLRMPTYDKDGRMAGYQQILSKYGRYFEWVISRYSTKEGKRWVEKSERTGIKFRQGIGANQTIDTSRGNTFSIRVKALDERSAPTPPWTTQKTVPISTLFGVPIGATIDEIELPHFELKTPFASCQYGFTPKKKFRQFDMYCFQIVNGRVHKIIGAWQKPKKKNRKWELDDEAVKAERAAVRNILKEKYKIHFAKRSQILYAGTGEDYTFLSEFNYEYKTKDSYKPKKYWAVELSTDERRISADKRQEEKRVSEEKARKIRLDGIDAL